MKRLFVLLALFLWPAGLGAQQPRTPPAAKPLAFTHVTVIDATGAPPKNDLTVIITGDRITALGKAGEVKVPADAQVIDATGKFMIPGLWDMHAHLPTPDFLRLFVANGVTSVREMGGAGNLATQWRRWTKEGRMLGPRLTVAGVIVDGPKPVWPASATVADEKQGQQTALALKQRGMDFIKVYSLLPRAGYLALAAEAKVQGIPFAGHVPFSVGVEEAVNAGQQSIEHLDMLW